MTEADPLGELQDGTVARSDLEARSASLRVAASNARERSYLGRQVVNVALGVAILLVIYVLFAPFAWQGGWNAIKVPAEYASTILTSVLLPLATLVLGHYFGTMQMGS